MNKISFLAGIICLVLAASAGAGDIRRDFQDLENKRKALALDADRELKAAREKAREKAEKIRGDKAALKAAIAAMKSKNTTLKGNIKGLKSEIKTLDAENKTLRTDLEASRAVNKELAGFVRTYAKDLESLLVQSPQSAFISDRQAFLGPVIHQERFWSMDDVQGMSRALFEEIRASGQVRLETGPIIDRSGKDRTADILVLGNFTAIYTLDTKPGKERGFLLYSDQSQRFFALSKLPSAMLGDQLDDYLSGRSESVPLDISRGGALRRYTHELNLAEQVPKGGPIVWPILVILGLAVLILLERLGFFLIRGIRPEPFMNQVRTFVDKEDWDGCAAFMAGRKKALISRVLLKALPFRDQSREDMENALQEAILGEIPSIERFLSTLGMLAAIAPLMGLLGTVTGMINTFHVITYYGAGDPRMMSGGISEALVTTMLGLAVAIPIMLCHTLISRRVETQINQMEEKAVSFVNLVFKARHHQCCHPGTGDA